MEQQRRANGKKIPGQVLKKNQEKRAMETAFVVLMIAVVIGVYSVASAAVSRFNWKLDLTEGQVFQMTDTTREILDHLDQDITILCCNTSANADANVVEVLNRYVAASSHIHVKYVDLSANPSLAETYASQNITLSKDGVLVTCGKKAQFINWIDLYQVKTYTDSSGSQKYNLTGLKAESQLTGAIANVTTQEVVGVAFTAGHSENAPDALKSLIGSSNYQVGQVVLGVNPIPEHTGTVVIAGAKRDFSEREIQLLDEFMKNGGNLMVFRDPEIASLPNLDHYLQKWGLSIGDQVVLEPRQQMDSPLNIIPDFGVSMMNVYFSEHSTYVVLPKCRQLLLDNVNSCITNEVLKSTSSAYGKSLNRMSTLEKETGDSAGPFAVAATSERNYTDAGGETKTQYVFLTACTGFYDDSYLKTTSIGNADFVLQALAYLNKHDVALNIPVKSLEASSISISWAATVAFAVIFVAILPLGLLITGVTLYLKRRHS